MIRSFDEDSAQEVQAQVARALFERGVRLFEIRSATPKRSG